MSESEAVPGALDRLVRMDPTRVANFVLSTSVVRESVVTAGEALLVLPERGSMPIYWAADGHLTEESRICRDGIVRPPIGSYDFEAPDHTIRKGTLAQEQKQRVVSLHSQELRDASRVLIVDEVQKGGTITELVNIVRKLRGTEANVMYVVAAQDSRKKVAAEQKKEGYQRMVAGNTAGVSASVVPMPLIGTDCDPLLNRLWYPGQTRIPVEFTPPIEIHPNEEAELILRTLGTAARNPEALEDTSVLDRDVFSFNVGEKAAGRIEAWREALIHRLQDRTS
jgi:hypothetical protein